MMTIKLFKPHSKCMEQDVTKGNIDIWDYEKTDPNMTRQFHVWSPVNVKVIVSIALNVIKRR